MTAFVATAAVAATAAALANYRLGISTDVHNIRHDRAFSQRLTSLVERLGERVTLYHLLELADPRADALWFEGRSYNYKALKYEVDWLAERLCLLGVKAGDNVAVYMTNSPEMVFTIYALAKLGAAPALINSALKDDTLLHCVRLARSDKIICTPDLATFAAAAAQSIDASFQHFSLDLGSFPYANKSAKVNDLVKAAATKTAKVLTASVNRSISDTAALIYTSGTTGKPKACSIKNMMICSVACPSSADASDPKRYLPVRTYSCMPLFHGTTFFTGICYSVGTSGAFCLARKFSASRFWQDVCESRSTRILYVGELCRYLLASPPSSYDRAHRCIVAQGNGLQRDVWLKFKARFGVPEVREFYRSTEGLAKFDNRHRRGKVGAGKVGYAGAIKRKYEDDVFIVKFDHDTEQPYRDPKTGFCVRAAPGEAGEAIGRIRSMATYTDYLDNVKATEEKFLRNVFATGDLFQRSGDLLVHDSSGWVRFQDRIGDTFRWKGENVSAGEVRAYISDLPEVSDVIVVGLRLNNYDGQVGIAAVTLASPTAEIEADFMGTLCSKLKMKGVPAYAIPRLISITHQLAVGDTFKHAKQTVKQLNWDPAGPDSSGSNYWLDGDTYKRLDSSAWAAIKVGSAKL